jgi:hypothetical protein
VVIRLAEITKAKPDANTRTRRPDKCLVVKLLDSSLRPIPLRNMESTAITTREGLRHFDPLISYRTLPKGGRDLFWAGRRSTFFCHSISHNRGFTVFNNSVIKYFFKCSL